MKVYRIARVPFQNDLSGKGSFLFGGRWNSEGVYALYTSTHRSLALLETLVHVPLNVLNTKEYHLLEIEIRSKLEFPIINSFENSQQVGDQLLKEDSTFGFWVPSVIFPQEQNLILNPVHPQFESQVRITCTNTLSLDNRLSI